MPPRTPALLRIILICLIASLKPPLYAHQQPTTLIALDIGSHQVDMELQLPLSELELAFGHDVTTRPSQVVHAPAFRDYLLAHIQPATTNNEPWSVHVINVSLSAAVQTQSGPFQEAVAHLTAIPPPGATPRDFILRYDVILHQVVTHKAFVSVRSDWAGGRIQPAEVGVIAVDTADSQICPLTVHLGAGSAWDGFLRMVRLGMEHIREGIDHLLFLLVLLLPATLNMRNFRWSEYAGTQASLLRLLKIVTAFTAGHSITLLVGALNLVSIPQQPVEVLIAFSILITAIHAIRPIFPGREAQIAAAFGLIHGLAFATVLAGLHLSAGPMALSILGFNLGIEIMQLLVVVMTMPWLLLLSLTPAHSAVRIAGALLAAIAASGWIVNRVSGEPNAIERAMNIVNTFAPLGILVLASIAIPTFMYTVIAGRHLAPAPKESN